MNMPHIPENIDHLPFFFIVGRPRSGTTLLRTLFDAHPNVAFPLECKFALDLYPKYGKIARWTDRDTRNFLKDLQEQLLFDTWTIDMDSLKADLAGINKEYPYAHVCRIVYLNYRSFFPKEDIRMIGDKNPGYTIYTRKLARLFPGAKFIHIIRDHRDNYLSLKNTDFELPCPALAAAKWKLFYRKFNRDSMADSRNYCLVRYEDLVSRPEEEIRKLCLFLGLPYRPEVFNFDEKKEDVLKAYPDGFVERYHANLLNKVNASRVGLWKEKLSMKEVLRLDYAAGKAAVQAGYQASSGRFPLWVRISASPGIAAAYLLAFLTRVVDSFPYRLRIAILNKWPLYLAVLYHRLTGKKS